MNNILISLKKFITNKNVVTVIGVIIILALLYWGYNSTIEKETSPVKIPVANQTIQPRTKITDDMISWITVPGASVSSNVKRTSASIIGMYTAVNTVIPQGSMFYSDVLVKESELPDSAFVEVEEGQRPYALSVTTASTYGNSIFPGNTIDIFMKATDESGQVMVGRLLSDVKVLAVKDSSGNNVFEDTSANRTPATLTFGVPEDIFILLKKAEYLKSIGVELFPVPLGGTVEVTNSISVDRAELVSYIESKSVTFSDNTTEQNVNETIQAGIE
jgi:Flp pilus assembly protein CpaB